MPAMPRPPLAGVSASIAETLRATHCRDSHSITPIGLHGRCAAILSAEAAKQDHIRIRAIDRESRIGNNACPYPVSAPLIRSQVSTGTLCTSQALAELPASVETDVPVSQR